MESNPSPEERLAALGIDLPSPLTPLGAYVPCVSTGSLVFLSGVLPLRNGSLRVTGRAGESASLGEAQEEARQAVINALAVLKDHLGDLCKVTRCVKLNGFVASAPGFTEQPKVLNAASDILFEAFGERGRHARAAVGVSSLPLNAVVEIDLIFETAP